MTTMVHDARWTETGGWRRSLVGGILATESD